MKKFKEYAVTPLDPKTILGRNLKAKAHYQKLLKTDPEEAHYFLYAYSFRNKTYNFLYELLKRLTSEHLYYKSKKNITSGNNLEQAYHTMAQEIAALYPKLTPSQIIRELRNTEQDNAEIAVKLIDRIYPELKGL